jgi:XTP/dITP diphosphohydrolase
MKICFATRNVGKRNEIQSMLEGMFQVQTLDEIGCKEEIAETGTTLEENSRIKASHVWNNYKVSCFADDSGLEVEVLKGAPGVYSSSYGGEEGNAEKNITRLLTEMKTVTNRRAQFRTVVTLILNGVEHQFEGTCEGVILNEKVGNKGFGYDPVFRPDGHDITFAEMDTATKNAISHRGKAVRKLISFLTMIK